LTAPQPGVLRHQAEIPKKIKNVGEPELRPAPDGLRTWALRSGRAIPEKRGGCCRHEPIVRYQIENPETIKRCPSPKESDCGETCHNRAKEQENAYRGESSRLTHNSGTSCAEYKPMRQRPINP
jgi:hypothetical protein